MASILIFEERELRDLCELSKYEPFVRITASLRARRDRLRQETEDIDGGDLVHKLRGASGELNEILRYFETPEKTYSEIMTRKAAASARRQL
jgi:hypothetical protein